MDWLDRLEEREERFRAVRRPEPTRRMDEPPKTTHSVTIIGVIRGVDGWYRAGYDEQTKTIVPLELIQKTELNE